jgi:ATP-binding cassette subfamily B protein
MRANGAIGYVMRRFHGILQPFSVARRKSGQAWYWMEIYSLLTLSLSSALALGLGTYLWSRGFISFGTVYIAFYFTTMLNGPLEAVRQQFQVFQQAGAGIVRLRQLLRIQPALVDGPGATFSEGAMAVSFANVTFCYTPERTTLTDITFDLPAGHVLGLLGRTGSGKTTIARLLLRLYDVDEGAICLGGIDVRQACLKDLRKHIGIVTQDVQLFQASVRDNLTFFDSTISDERIMVALADLGLENWLQVLPNGLDTLLGSDGNGLSAGEAQLLAFTRVFLANPGLIILDEASSRLDPATEQLIERAVSKLLTGRTGIIIAHRLATVQRADAILVLVDGQVHEYGARNELAQDVTSHYAQLISVGIEEVLA